MIHWEELLLSPEDTIGQAMQVIDHTAAQFVMVCDSNRKLLGVLTDGNIRRGLLSNFSLKDPVHKVMFTTPATVSAQVNAEEALCIMQKSDYSHLPIVTEDNTLISLWSYKALLGKSPLDIPVLLMAGGLGSRLGALTKSCPKPMLRIAGKPILEITINNFKEHGFKNFYISINYLPEIIEDYFGDGTQFGVSIQYLRESERLGTAGPLSLLPSQQHPVIIMNGDILTQLNPRMLLVQHMVRNAQSTMVIKQHSFQVPYGVITSRSTGELMSMEEKPSLTVDISAGINIFSPEAINLVPKGKFFDIPDLFSLLLQQKFTVQTYKTNAYWLDIGQLEDYQRANGDFKDFFLKEPLVN